MISERAKRNPICTSPDTLAQRNYRQVAMQLEGRHTQQAEETMRNSATSVT
jgi:hypothetical protein